VGGRLVSRDPIGFEGSPWNLFGYVNNQPMVLRDPSGLHGTCCDGIYYDPNKQCCIDGELFDRTEHDLVTRVDGSPGLGGHDFNSYRELIEYLNGIADKPCNCINTLVISNHGGTGGYFPVSTPDDEGIEEDLRFQDLSELASLLCEDGTLEIRMCHGFEGAEGRAAAQRLANELGRCVIGYESVVNPYGGRPFFCKTSLKRWPDAWLPNPRRVVIFPE
jgi:hypothetical protein